VLFHKNRVATLLLLEFSDFVQFLLHACESLLLLLPWPGNEEKQRVNFIMFILIKRNKKQQNLLKTF